MNKVITFISALVGLSSAYSNPVLLNENFNGANINPAKWETFTPYSDTTVTVDSGSAKLLNGGGLLSTGEYEAPIEVHFSFAFLGNVHDSFRLNTRVDDFRSTGYHVEHGVGVSFRIMEDTGNLFGNVALEDSSGTLATGTFALTGNNFYAARLVDTGSAIGFYWGTDLNPFLTANTAEHYGDKIATWNRHGAGAGSSISAGSKMGIDYIKVMDLDRRNKVPEGGMTATLTGVGILGLIAARRIALSCVLKGLGETSRG